MPTKITCREYDRKKGVPVPGLQRLDVSSSAILDMIRQGKGFKETAKHFGISKSTICHRLQRDFPKEYRKLRMNPTTIQYFARCAAAYRAYKEEGSAQKAGKKLGISKNTVMYRARFMERVLGEKFPT